MNNNHKGFTIEELTKQTMDLEAFLESIQDSFYKRDSEERNEQMDKIIEEYYL